MEYLLDRIKELICPLFESAQVDLVDLKLRREKGRLFLKFLVDKPEGGITLDECANLNTQLSLALDDADLVQESFVLEVSSPGMDRPLSTVKDFRRVINWEIRVFLSEPVEQRLEFQGKLVRVEEEGIGILFGSKEVVIPLDKINKARQVIELKI